MGYNINKEVHMSTKWMNLCPNNLAAQYVDEVLGLDFIALTINELVRKSNIPIEEWIKFLDNDGVKLERNNVQKKLNEINSAASISKELEAGASLAQLKSAKSLLNDDSDDKTKFIWALTPSLNKPLLNILHTCPSCSIEFYCGEMEDTNNE